MNGALGSVSYHTPQRPGNLCSCFPTISTLDFYHQRLQKFLSRPWTFFKISPYPNDRPHPSSRRAAPEHTDKDGRSGVLPVGTTPDCSALAVCLTVAGTIQPLSPWESLAVLKFVLECSPSTWSPLVTCLASYSQYHACFSPQIMGFVVSLFRHQSCGRHFLERCKRSIHVCTHTCTHRQKHTCATQPVWDLILGGETGSVLLRCPRNCRVTAPTVLQQYGCLKKRWTMITVMYMVKWEREISRRTRSN